MTYFSDREHGRTPRTNETIEQRAWGGILATYRTYTGDADGSFGATFPLQCQDDLGPYGTDVDDFGLAVQAEIPDLDWPPHSDTLPPTLAILDFIEFCHHHAAQPIQGSYHAFFGHHHLAFNREAGQENYRTRVNQILARNGLAYELQTNGRIERLAPPILRETLAQHFNTNDQTLDDLLTNATNKFLNPDPAIRQEALKDLWDAWERAKTLHNPNKQHGTRTLLDNAATEPQFRQFLEDEARALTDTGNTFHIRHSETTQTPLEHPRHIDYLFHRLYALLQLLLR